MDVPLAIMRPEVDQLPGSCKNLSEALRHNPPLHCTISVTAALCCNLIIAFAVELVVPLSDSEVGVTVQLPFGGTPEQVNPTVPVKPLIGLSVNV